MLPGWEDETSPLNDEEKEWAKYIATIIERFHIGKENACTSERIIQGILKKYDKKINGVRVRKMINVLRTTRTVKRLVSSSKGYYIATDPLDMKRHQESLLHHFDSKPQPQ